MLIKILFQEFTRFLKLQNVVKKSNTFQNKLVGSYIRGEVHNETLFVQVFGWPVAGGRGGLISGSLLI